MLGNPVDLEKTLYKRGFPLRLRQKVVNYEIIIKHLFKSLSCVCVLASDLSFAVTTAPHDVDRSVSVQQVVEWEAMPVKRWIAHWKDAREPTLANTSRGKWDHGVDLSPMGTGEEPSFKDTPESIVPAENEILVRVEESAPTQLPKVPRYKAAEALVVEPSPPPTLPPSPQPAPSRPSGARSRSRTLSVGTVKGRLSVKLDDRVVPNAEPTLNLGDTVALQMQGNETVQNIFVEETGILAWQEHEQRFVARGEGSTKIYLVTQSGQNSEHKKMLIVPVTVGRGAANDLASLSVPRVLTSLLDDMGTRATTTHSAGPTAADTGFPSLKTDQQFVSVEPLVPVAGKEASTPISVKPISNLANDRFGILTRNVGSTNINVRVVDQSSTLKASQIYGAAGVWVRIPGTSFAEQTNSFGQLERPIPVPNNSRMLITVDDPTGRFIPTVAEFVAREHENSGEEFAIRVMSSDVQAEFFRLKQWTSDPSRGSLCGMTAQAGISVNVRTLENDPKEEEIPEITYFDDSGFPDWERKDTSANGRFCVYNVKSGPTAFTFSDAEGERAAIPTVIWAGRHLETDFQIDEQGFVHTHTMDAAKNPSGGYNAVEAMVNLYPLDWGDPFRQDGPGRLSSSEAVAIQKGRAYFLVDSPAMERELVPYDFKKENRSSHVTRLFPAGYFQSRADSDVVFDSTLGIVIVEHRTMGGQGDNEALQIRLVDEFGREIGQKISTEFFDDGETGVRREAFANVRPGLCNVIVQNQDGVWIQADDALVFADVPTFVGTGSELVSRDTAYEISSN